MMADNCEPLAVSWQLKVLNDGGWQDVILNGRRRRAVGFSSVLRGEAHFRNCG